MSSFHGTSPRRRRKVVISIQPVGMRRRTKPRPNALHMANRSLMARFPAHRLDEADVLASGYRVLWILIGPREFRRCGTGSSASLSAIFPIGYVIPISVCRQFVAQLKIV